MRQNEKAKNARCDQLFFVDFQWQKSTEEICIFIFLDSTKNRLSCFKKITKEGKIVEKIV
jgi:hypothetical protein